MRIVIDISAANDPDAHGWLDRTLYRIEDRWHVWEPTDTPDLGALEATTWIGGRGALGDRVRELLRRSTQRDAWTPNPHGRRLRVTAHPAAADELAPEHAFRLADEPLVILVENRDSDGAFVTRVVNELDDLPDADREVLATGFGRNVDECWNRWDVREVGNELRTRGRGDLEHGIKLIRQEL